jgi:kynurenine formamidase
LVDLSLPIIDGGGFGMPAKITYMNHRERVMSLSEKYGLPPEAFGGRANAVEILSSLTCHAGTHLDAPWHYGEETNEGPALTVDKVPLDWCFGHGVWLDLSHKKPGEDILEADIQQAVEAIHYTLRPKDIVLIRTGASAYYGQPGCEEMGAGMTREATLWLGDQGIRVVGTDASIWDRPIRVQMEEIQERRVTGRYMEGHRAAGERGMCILEWLTNLDQLPHVGFQVYAFPIKVANAGAGWARVVALCPE